MGRRKIEQTPEYAAMLETVNDMLKDERDEIMAKHNGRVDNNVLKIIRQWAKTQK